MKPPFKTQAVILRRTNYGEADRVISFLTPERGKISAIAKGVRKPKSKLAGGLELLAVCDVTFIEGRGEMALLTSARLNRFYSNILHEYDRMTAAFTFIKFINRAVETVSEPDFYYLLQNGLEYLDATHIDWQLTELWFRMHLRVLLGHGLNVVTDHFGAKLEAGKRYQYDFSEQGFYEDPNGRFGEQHIKLLRLITTKTPAILRQIGGIEQVLEDCLWLVRTFET